MEFLHLVKNTLLYCKIFKNVIHLSAYPSSTALRPEVMEDTQWTLG